MMVNKAKKEIPSYGKIALMLGATQALTPLGIDAYIPAIPTIAEFFGSDISTIQASLSSFLIGMGIGSLIGGPLSDRYGRRIICLVGIAIFIVSSIVLLNVVTAEQFITVRFFQAVGGGFTLVIVGAMARDLYSGKEAARLFALIGMIMLVAPLIAPPLGTFILLWFSWKIIFVALIIYSALIAVMMIFMVPETRVRDIENEAPTFLKDAMIGYMSVFDKREALPYLFTLVFSGGVLFTYITEAAFIYMEYYGISEENFFWYFGSAVALVMLLNRTTALALRWHEPRTLCMVGVYLQSLAALGLALVTLWFESPTLWMVMPLLIICIGCIGLIMPNSIACYMSCFHKRAGAANAMSSVAVFVFGAAVGTITTTFHDGTLVPIAITIMICGLISAIAISMSKPVAH